MSSDPYGSQDPNRSGSYEDYSQGYPSAPQQPAQPYTQPTYGAAPAQDPYGQPTYAQQPYVQQGYQAGYNATPTYGLAPYAAALDTNPRPSVTMPQAVKLWLKNWKNFSGRASRSEFWWTYLSIVIVEMVLGIVLMIIAFGIIAATNGSDASGFLALLLYGVFGLTALALVVPSVSLAVRRMHDTNQSGWLALVTLIPSVGSIILLVLAAQPSNPAGARFDDAAQPLFGPEHL